MYIVSAFPGPLAEVRVFVSSSDKIDEDGVSCANVTEVAQSAKVEAFYFIHETHLFTFNEVICDNNLHSIK